MLVFKFVSRNGTTSSDAHFDQNAFFFFFTNSRVFKHAPYIAFSLKENILLWTQTSFATDTFIPVRTSRQSLPLEAVSWFLLSMAESGEMVLA